MAERSAPLGVSKTVLLERNEIALLLRSDGTSRAFDSFGFYTESKGAHDDAKAFVILLRPLPTRMARSSCNVHRSGGGARLVAYRVDEPVWSLDPGTSLLNVALGEDLFVYGKNQHWTGRCLYSDTTRIVLYDGQAAQIIDRAHVSAVTVRNVPPHDAPHFANANVLLMQMAAGATPYPKQGEKLVQLSYDLDPGALSFATHHVLAFGENTLRFSSFVEVANNSGVHLVNARICIKQRRSDCERREVASGSDSGGTEQQTRSRGLAAAAPPALAASEATIDLHLSASDFGLHLAPNTRTKMSAFEARDVPAKLRYHLRATTPAIDGNATTNYSAYTDATRVLEFSRKDLPSDEDNALLSGLAVVQDANGFNEPLSEGPAYVDAWQNLESGRMRVDLGTNGGVRWRTYVESQRRDEKASMVHLTCRLDVLVLPHAVGELLLKFEALLAQARIQPEMRPAFRRLPKPEMNAQFLAPADLPESGLVRSGLVLNWQTFTPDASFRPHDSERDDAVADHFRTDFAPTVSITQQDVEAYQKHRFPLMLCFYYTVGYVTH